MIDTDLPAIPKVEIVRVPPDAPLEDIRRALMVKSRLKEILAEAIDAIEHDATEWIKANHPVEVGDTFYWVGKSKPTPKCFNIPGALDAAMKAAGGDEDAAARVLVSQPIKYGAFRSLVGDEAFPLYFKTDEPSDKLESGTQEQCEKKLKSMPKYMIE